MNSSITAKYEVTSSQGLTGNFSNGTYTTTAYKTSISTSTVSLITTAEKDGNKDDGPNVGAIVGGVLGSLTVSIFLVVVIIILIKKRDSIFNTKLGLMGRKSVSLDTKQPDIEGNTTGDKKIQQSKRPTRLRGVTPSISFNKQNDHIPIQVSSKKKRSNTTCTVESEKDSYNKDTDDHHHGRTVSSSDSVDSYDVPPNNKSVNDGPTSINEDEGIMDDTYDYPNPTAGMVAASNNNKSLYKVPISASYNNSTFNYDSPRSNRVVKDTVGNGPDDDIYVTPAKSQDDQVLDSEPYYGNVEVQSPNGKEQLIDESYYGNVDMVPPATKQDAGQSMLKDEPEYGNVDYEKQNKHAVNQRQLKEEPTYGNINIVN